MSRDLTVVEGSALRRLVTAMMDVDVDRAGTTGRVRKQKPGHAGKSLRR
jgi:hypothetical protein